MSAFVKAQRTDHRVPVATSCRALGLSQSWFYKHVDRKPTAREIQRQELDEAIESAFHANDGEYGSPRIHAELLDRPRWQSLSVNTVARRMAARSLCAAHKRRRKCTTRADSSVQHAPNLLARDFDPPAPNIAWAGDITQVNTWQGPIFTATVIDLFSRRLIGFSVAESANAGLVTDALKMALATRGGGACGVIMHTDRGSQYTSGAFVELCAKHRIVRSNSRSGSCLDNAAAEAFFSRLKCERIYRRTLRTRADARESIISWFHRYNHTRRHSYCGMLPPVLFEARMAAISVTNERSDSPAVA